MLLLFFVVIMVVVAVVLFCMNEILSQDLINQFVVAYPANVFLVCRCACKR